MRKCCIVGCSEIASFHSKCCTIALLVYKQSLLDFFKIVDSRLILMLLYVSLILLSVGFTNHIWVLGAMGQKVKLGGLDYVAYKMCQCAVILEDKVIMPNVFGSY